jgi:hypothetical protein
MPSDLSDDRHVLSARHGGLNAVADSAPCAVLIVNTT